MKERGIIFNAEMVRAILDGRKTQTRRVMKVQPTPSKSKDGDYWFPCNKVQSMVHVSDFLPDIYIREFFSVCCPFGKIGDRLWVRETFALLGNEDGVCVDWNDGIVYDEKEAAIIYKASCEQKDGDYGLWSIPDDSDWKPHTDNHKYNGTWRPSIHMPRWASRILLEITDVRVEQLQDISERDCVSESIGSAFLRDYKKPQFMELWKSIYGVDGWNSNPWVWVIEFKLLTAANKKATKEAAIAHTKALLSFTTKGED